jgi:hypothetical protein
MDKDQIRIAYVQLQEKCIPEILDDSIKIVIKMAMTQAFLFGIECANNKKNEVGLAELIYEGEHQFDF